MIILKTCSKCLELKPLKEFGKDKYQKDGKRKVCKTCSRAYSQKYWEENAEWLKPLNREYKKNNRENIKAQDKIYRKENADRIRETQRVYKNWRYNNDPVYRVTAIVRTRINQALNGKVKPGRSEKLLGCSWQEFKEHIESQFKEGMHWGNLGLKEGMWVIDHIRPIASFDLRIEENFYSCFNYKNQQPMWYEKNMKKGALWNGKRWRQKSGDLRFEFKF